MLSSVARGCQLSVLPCCLSVPESILDDALPAVAAALLLLLLLPQILPGISHQLSSPLSSYLAHTSLGLLTAGVCKDLLAPQQHRQTVWRYIYVYTNNNIFYIHVFKIFNYIFIYLVTRLVACT